MSIVRACWAAKDVPALIAQVLALCKRRGQAKTAITELVQLALSYLPALPTRSAKEDLIAALKAVTDGRLYVEIERARAIKALAEMLEEEGRIAEASEALQEVAVETFGSMEKKEKAEFLLEQVRLERARGRAGMSSRAPFFHPRPPRPPHHPDPADARAARLCALGHHREQGVEEGARGGGL